MGRSFPATASASPAAAAGDAAAQAYAELAATLGVPNWIDAAGLPTGMIFWRFLLPEENVAAIESEVVAVDSLR